MSEIGATVMGDLTLGAAVGAAPQLTTSGPLLRAARQRAGLELGEVAEKAIVWDGLLIDVEAGTRRPTLLLCCRLCEAIGVDKPTKIAIYRAAEDDKAHGRGGLGL